MTDRPIPLFAMMDRLGLTPGSGALPGYGLEFIAAEHACRTCPHQQACRAWLASHPDAPQLAPRFCSNADILFAWQMEQLVHLPAMAAATPSHAAAV